MEVSGVLSALSSSKIGYLAVGLSYPMQATMYGYAEPFQVAFVCRRRWVPLNAERTGSLFNWYAYTNNNLKIAIHFFDFY